MSGNLRMEDTPTCSSMRRKEVALLADLGRADAPVCVPKGGRGSIDGILWLRGCKSVRGAVTRAELCTFWARRMKVQDWQERWFSASASQGKGSS